MSEREELRERLVRACWFEGTQSARCVPGMVCCMSWTIGDS